MKTLFRAVIMLALSTWLGALSFFPFLAQISFRVESNKQTAGAIVGACLIALHKIGLVCGVLMLVLLCAALLRRSWIRRASRRALYAAILLVLLMLSLTAVSQFWVIPHMDADRVAAGGAITLAPLNDPHRVAFERLHKASVQIEGSVMLLGLGLIVALALSSADPTPEATADARLPARVS